MAPYNQQKLIKLLGKEAQMQVFGEYVYTVFDVADFFGVKVASVNAWINHGELRAGKVGRTWWIRGSAINDFVKAREAGQAARVEARNGQS